MMRTHDLRIWPEYFERVADGSKPFEVRYNDRDYQVGDVLILREWDNGPEKYTGRFISKTVGYVMAGGSFGISNNTVILGLATDRACEWQPIDTAPKDGSTIIAFWPPTSGPVHGGCYGTAEFYCGHWCDPEDSDDFFADPSHWIPLPAIPGNVKPISKAHS